MWRASNFKNFTEGILYTLYVHVMMRMHFFFRSCSAIKKNPCESNIKVNIHFCFHIDKQSVKLRYFSIWWLYIVVKDHKCNGIIKKMYRITAPMYSLAVLFPFFSSSRIFFSFKIVAHFLFVLNWKMFNCLLLFIYFFQFHFAKRAIQFTICVFYLNVRLIDFTGMKWNRSHNW